MTRKPIVRLLAGVAVLLAAAPASAAALRGFTLWSRRVAKDR